VAPNCPLGQLRPLPGFPGVRRRIQPALAFDYYDGEAVGSAVDDDGAFFCDDGASNYDDDTSNHNDQWILGYHSAGITHDHCSR